MTKKLTFIVAILLLSMGPAVALTEIDKIYSDIHSSQTLESQISLFLSHLNRPLTVVGGYTCSDLPEDSGQCTAGVDCKIYCPDYLSGGCAIQIYNENYQFLQEYDFSHPGMTLEVDSPQGAVLFYENYYCDEDCDCSAWVQHGCGAGPCSDEYMYKTRTCNIGCDLETEVCQWKDFCGVVEPCHDSDGYNLKTKGYVIDEGVTYYDYCSSSRDVMEYGCASVCVNNRCYTKTEYDCSDEFGSDYRCVNGRCIKSTDTTTTTTTIPNTTTTLKNWDDLILGGSIFGIGIVLLVGAIAFIIILIAAKNRRKNGK